MRSGCCCKRNGCQCEQDYRSDALPLNPHSISQNHNFCVLVRVARYGLQSSITSDAQSIWAQVENTWEYAPPWVENGRPMLRPVRGQGEVGERSGRGRGEVRERSERGRGEVGERSGRGLERSWRGRGEVGERSGRGQRDVGERSGRGRDYIHIHASTQAHKHTRTQAHKRASTQAPLRRCSTCVEPVSRR
jgi:hypothetical protein